MAGLQGLQQTEEQIDASQLAWDEVTNELLEGEEVQADANMAILRKRPDAWAVSWEILCLLILEFTLPNDRCERSLNVRDTESYRSFQESYRTYNFVSEIEIRTVRVLSRPYNEGTYGRCAGMARRPLTV